MDEKTVISLIKQYNEGTISPEDKVLLDTWYLKYASESRIELSKEVETAMIERLRTELPVIYPVQKKRLWPRLVIAAASVAIILCGIWLYTNIRQTDTLKNEQVATSDIAPGRNTATLRLANGKQIQLSDAKSGVVISANSLKYNDGEKVGGSAPSLQSPESRIMSVSTPRGGTYQVILPDGTKVWLNAASSLEFPVSYEGAKERTAVLQGEAYFEIFKNEAQKFVLTTKSAGKIPAQRVEVLGTHFNINSYPDEGNTTTTLLEGSVKINENTFLKPGQQAELSENGTLKVSAANVEVAAGWKDGFFRFDRADLPAVMRQISRWYDIDVKYEGKIPEASFDGKVYRNLNLSKALDVLKYTNVKFRLEGKTIIITP